MSQEISKVEREQFDSEVKHAYAAEGGELAKVVRVKKLTNAGSHKFSKYGRGVAREKIPFTKPATIRPVIGTAKAVTSDFVASDYSDIFLQAKTDVDERKALAKAIGDAIRRREDQQIIDEALKVSSTTKVVAKSVGGANTGLNVTKLRKIRSLFRKANVPSGDLHYVGDSDGADELLGETQVTSSDYNNVKSLVNGDISSFLGINFHWIGQRDEGGIGLKDGDAATRVNYAFHGGAMGCIGLVQCLSGSIMVDWVAELTSYYCQQLLSCGAINIDDEGIVKVETHVA